MLLRRFSQHIKDQNWFAVGLDVIVVVVGIFLGMQVTEWNEENKQHLKEKQILQRLTQEFTAANEYIENSIADVEIRITEGKKLTQLMRTEGPISAKEFRETLLKSAGYPLPSNASTTYTELVTNGDLMLLSSEALRHSLIEHSTALERRIMAHYAMWEVGQYDNVTFARVMMLSEFKDINQILIEDIKLSDLQTVFSLSNFLKALEKDAFLSIKEKVQDVLIKLREHQGIDNSTASNP